VKGRTARGGIEREGGRKGEGREGTKEGMQRGEVEGVRGKFRVNLSLCRLPVAKNHNFGQILTLGTPVPTPFYR